jgi:UDP-2,3-diacylglucosamine pyrophosphatase LpxH
LLVVSDLHLSQGCDPETGKTSRLEDFFRDDAFARFLRYHEGIRDQPRFGGRPWLLILNGDLFDFLQVVSLPEDGMPLRTVRGVDDRSELSASERAHGLGTTAGESAWKLKQIARGHPRFFAALGWFVAHGNRVLVVRGNHDVDLHWEEVQECLVMETQLAYMRQRSKDGRGPPLSPAACRKCISFSPWLYYEAGRIYVEHGGQYDALNHFHDFLNPVLPDDPERIELPMGSLFVRYLFNKVEDVHPFADNVKPLTRYLKWAFRSDPIRTMELLLSRGWVFLRALWKTGQKAARAALHGPPEDVSAHEEPSSLPAAVTKEIKALARWRVETFWQTWAGSALQGLVRLLTVLIIGAFIALAGVSLVMDSARRWLAGVYLAMAILAAVLGRGLQHVLSRMLEQSYLLEVAQNLEEILKPAGGVRYIVMGHDHRPMIERLEKAWYVNTGAWVPLYEKEGPIEGRESLTFFRLTRDHQGTPELLRWDDAGGAPTRMVLE